MLDVGVDCGQRRPESGFLLFGRYSVDLNVDEAFARFTGMFGARRLAGNPDDRPGGIAFNRNDRMGDQPDIQSALSQFRQS